MFDLIIFIHEKDAGQIEVFKKKIPETDIIVYPSVFCFISFSYLVNFPL